MSKIIKNLKITNVYKDDRSVSTCAIMPSTPDYVLITLVNPRANKPDSVVFYGAPDLGFAFLSNYTLLSNGCRVIGNSEFYWERYIEKNVKNNPEKFELLAGCGL